MKASSDFVFMLDGDVQLVTVETLRLLVETATVMKLYQFFMFCFCIPT